MGDDLLWSDSFVAHFKPNNLLGLRVEFFLCFINPHSTQLKQLEEKAEDVPSAADEELNHSKDNAEALLHINSSTLIPPPAALLPLRRGQIGVSFALNPLHSAVWCGRPPIALHPPSSICPIDEAQHLH